MMASGSLWCLATPPSIQYIPQRTLGSHPLRPRTGFSIQRAREDVAVPAFHNFLNAAFDRPARAERSQPYGRIPLLEGAEIDVTRGRLFSLL